MKHYEEFVFSPAPGPEFSAAAIGNDPITAIGEVCIFFSQLEDAVTFAVGRLLAVEQRKALAICAQVGFKQKTNIFASLVRELKPPELVAEQLIELCRVCEKAESLRNQVVHSSWAESEVTKSLVRRKVTARAPKGLEPKEETLHVWQIMDITNYVIYAATCVEDYLDQWLPRSADGANNSAA